MFGCLILSHGFLAEASLEASKQIVGECKNLYSINCHDMTPESLYKEIISLLESENLNEGLFILVSLRGGSCWNAAAKIVMEYKNVKLISGLNLSMVLSFVTKQNQYSFEELTNILMNDAVRGIVDFKRR